MNRNKRASKHICVRLGHRFVSVELLYTRRRFHVKESQLITREQVRKLRRMLRSYARRVKTAMQRDFVDVCVCVCVLCARVHVAEKEREPEQSEHLDWMYIPRRPLVASLLMEFD